MSNRPLVLNFSASDSAGLAGMATDIRIQSALGVHALSVITANTAQNNDRVISVNAVTDSVFDDQLSAVSHLPIKALKVGLLGSVSQCGKIAHFVSNRSSEEELALIFDPVLASSSGSAFSSSDFILQLKSLLLSKTTLLTPNIPEVKTLTGIEIKSHDDIVLAANNILAMGVKAVLIKGGHFSAVNTGLVADYFTDGDKAFWLSNKKITTENTRGTGCALSSAIASSMTLGYSLYDAVVIGKMAISQGLRQSYSLELAESGSKQYGPVAITSFPDQQMDLPYLTQQPFTKEDAFKTDSFPACNQPLLGLYPVVESAKWIERLAQSGITTIQLRSKLLMGDELEREIVAAIKLAKKYNIRLFINDYWQLAIKHHAYGVHLGQEDLDGADIQQIKEAGLRLGISTHCHYEVARAHTYQPSYIACGPVYHTTTKDMPWVPHGLDGLAYWRKVLLYPLVAIGGINDERFDNIAASGVDSVAMITAITLSDNPVQTANNFVSRFKNNTTTSLTNAE